MANPFLALEGVSYALPNGRTLFSDLHESFDLRSTGLIGRNGAGKTVLARILAGQLAPSSGRCVRSGSVHYLAQHTTPPAQACVADLAGVAPVLGALQRIEAGSTAVSDFDAVGDRWDMAQRLAQALQQHGLGHVQADTPARQLSGGEAMRVALLGAWLSAADFLILDEPSNHLDQASRQALLAQLAHWPRGLIVVSHDRQLLAGMERTVELSSLGLRSYGGGYALYAASKAQERHSALAELERCKLERRKQEQALHAQRERQERKQARATRQGKQANQAQILLDRQKERSDHSAGKLQRQQAAAQAELSLRVREAAQQVEQAHAIHLHALSHHSPSPRQVLELEDVELPFLPPATRHISLTVNGQQRIAIRGPNGCGKSSLLKVIAGQTTPLAGHCRCTPAVAYLDQQLGQLTPERSVLEQLQQTNPSTSEGELRMLLAQLGLDAAQVLAPSRCLSGGERLKAALACLLYAASPPQLLLLDEPSNHLDLPSLQALEVLLSSYQGALLVVSHDPVFLDQLRLTEQLLATPHGWQLQPY